MYTYEMEGKNLSILNFICSLNFLFKYALKLISLLVLIIFLCKKSTFYGLLNLYMHLLLYIHFTLVFQFQQQITLEKLSYIIVFSLNCQSNMSHTEC